MAYTQVNLLAGKPAEDFLSQFYSLRAVPDGRNQKSLVWNYFEETADQNVTL